MDHLEEMEKFLEKHNLLKLKQEETKYEQANQRHRKWNCYKTFQQIKAQD